MTCLQSRRGKGRHDDGELENADRRRSKRHESGLGARLETGEDGGPLPLPRTNQSHRAVEGVMQMPSVIPIARSPNHLNRYGTFRFF